MSDTVALAIYNACPAEAPATVHLAVVAVTDTIIN